MKQLAVLGLGRAGNFHLQSLLNIPDARVATVFDLDPERARQIAAQQDCDASPSAEEAIASSNVDAVVVATPTDAHFELVKLALEHRKPVLTEKPLGRHLHEIDVAFELAESNGTPLFVAFQRRFDNSFANLVEQVHRGDVGQLQFVRSVSRDNPVPSIEYLKNSGGIFHDCVVHDLDMILQIAGETPTHVSAFASSFITEIGQINDFDNVVASLKFASGIVASIDVNRKSAFGYDQRIEAFGDMGMLQAENWHQTSVTRATSDGFTRPTIDESFPTRYRQAYQSELESFLRCVNGEQDVPILHEDVRVNHLLAVALERSAREQCVVALSDVEPNDSD